MALRRRLALGALTGGSLLVIYILCRYLENHLSLVPLGHCHGSTQRPSSSQDSLVRQSNSDQWSHPPHTSTLPPELSSGTVLPKHPQTPTPKTQTATAAKHKPGENNSLDNLKTTEPPYIGDTYMREVIPPQTNAVWTSQTLLRSAVEEGLNCSDGIRSRITKTELSGRFLKDVPVLQWAEHVTPKQHQRLSRYPGAHGWGGIEYKTLVETLFVLNSSANWQLLDNWKDLGNESECIRCAVVGNGGILKDSKKGKEIDSHHYVFRTNGAIINGFEQDVGSRTTHYTFSTNTLMNSMRGYSRAGFKGPPQSKETRYVFLPDHGRDYLLMKAAVTHTPVEQGPEKGKDPSKYFGQDVSAEKLKMYHPDFIRYLRNRFLRSSALKTKYKDIYRPSTGAVMLLAALHTCDQVSAYGFMTPDYKNYSDHYYDKTNHRVGFYINHDLRMEMNLWQQLHQAGLIRLYMHNEVSSNQK